MPLHRLQLTTGDYVSIVTCALLLYQPFVDRRALFIWIRDNIFGSERNLVSWGVFLPSRVVEWGSIFFFSTLYFLKIPFIERCKTYPNPWPWEAKDPVARKEAIAQHWNALFYLIKFHAVALIIAYAASLSEKSEHHLSLFSPDTIPHWTTAAWQVLLSSAITETSHYWCHRTLHYGKLYQWFHKKHHEFKDTTILATFYVTPTEAIVDALPAGLCLYFLDMHIYTIWMYTIPYILTAVWGHCGYTWPHEANPMHAQPFGTEIEMGHDLHHRISNCNYGGGYFIWDKLMGTFKEPTSMAPYLALKQIAADQAQATQAFSPQAKKQE